MKSFVYDLLFLTPVDAYPLLVGLVNYQPSSLHSSFRVCKSHTHHQLCSPHRRCSERCHLSGKSVRKSTMVARPKAQAAVRGGHLTTYPTSLKWGGSLFLNKTVKYFAIGMPISHQHGEQLHVRKQTQHFARAVLSV
eukprot:439647-Pyramimonas_sp.AAC.3